MVKKVLTFAASNQGAEATHTLLALQALADGTYVSLSKPVSQGAVLLLHTMCTRQNKKQTRRPNTQKVLASLLLASLFFALALNSISYLPRCASAVSFASPHDSRPTPHSL